VTSAERDEVANEAAPIVSLRSLFKALAARFHAQKHIRNITRCALLWLVFPYRCTLANPALPPSVAAVPLTM
jgi:hypothetical protein